MTLENNEGIVERVSFYKDCIGTDKTSTAIMITVFKEGETNDYFDLFLTKKKAEELRDQLDNFLKTEFNTDKIWTGKKKF